MRIGIIVGGWAFMGGLIEELKTHHTVSVLKYPFGRHRLEEFMRQLDVLYVEFFAGYMIKITNIPKHCKIVCRLHRGEVHGGWMKKVNFKKIDLLILVNNFMKEYAFKYQPSLRQVKETKVIQLGIDVEKFKYNPLRGYGKRIGWVGMIKEVKQPDLILNLMPHLPDWRLKFLAVPSVYKNVTRRVAGLVKQRRNVVWIKKLVPHDDMPKYYRGLDLFVNTSIIESQCVSVLEAMSCGVYPLIRNWPHPQCHPEQIYPEENLFTEMVECKRKIWSWVKLSTTKKKTLSQKMSQYVKKHYNLTRNIKQMREAIEQV